VGQFWSTERGFVFVGGNSQKAKSANGIDRPVWINAVEELSETYIFLRNQLYASRLSIITAKCQKVARENVRHIASSGDVNLKKVFGVSILGPSSNLDFGILLCLGMDM
jgi:hypothetical protein